MPLLEVIRTLVKYALCTCRLPGSSLLDGINWLLRFGTWLRRNRPSRRLGSREELYDYLQGELIGEEPITFLEFGVYMGDSFAHWLLANRHPESRFLGFDTFTGLPEEWKMVGRSAGSGFFDAEGLTPGFTDPRGEMVKGLFQETLPAIMAEREADLRSRRLVIHLDADLYSSTLYVLATLHAWLAPGTILIFDEFSSAAHEFRAFLDYTNAFRQNCRVVCSSGRLGEQMAFVVEPQPA